MVFTHEMAIRNVLLCAHGFKVTCKNNKLNRSNGWVLMVLTLRAHASHVRDSQAKVKPIGEFIPNFRCILIF